MIKAPYDPFQAPHASPDTAETLSHLWHDVVLGLDDDSFSIADRTADDARRERLWDIRQDLEERITRLQEPSLASVMLKLRVLSWHLNVMLVDEQLIEQQKIVASAIADAERLAAAT